MALLLKHLVFTPGILIFITKSFSSLTFVQLNPSIASYTLRPGEVFFRHLPKIRDEFISVQFSTNFLPYCQKSKADYVPIIKMFTYRRKRRMHLRYFAPANLYSAQTKESTIQPALLELGMRLQTPLRELIAPQNEFPRAPMMELATTISSSESSSRQNPYGPLLTVLTLQSAVNSGTVFDLNIAFNLFITAYPALTIIFNANNIQMKSPLRGTL